MKLSRRQTLVLMAGTAAALSARPAFATDPATVINVDLWDKGLDMVGAFDDSKPIMMGMWTLITIE